MPAVLVVVLVFLDVVAVPELGPSVEIPALEQMPMQLMVDPALPLIQMLELMEAQTFYVTTVPGQLRLGQLVMLPVRQWPLLPGPPLLAVPAAYRSQSMEERLMLAVDRPRPRSGQPLIHAIMVLGL